jgi:4-hydroxybenzoate polyprenyltransferase
MKALRALAAASHPGPSLAVTALTALLTIQAAPHGTGPLLTAPAMLALQLSVGWSNDAFDAARDTAAGRRDKPLATGLISRPAVWAAAGTALLAAVAMGFALGTTPGILTVAMAAAGWAYNAGLKSTPASGLAYLLGVGLVPAYAAAVLPGHPWPHWTLIVAAALIGLGAHFANVLPDLADDRAAGVLGLPHRVCAAFGEAAVRGGALALLLGSSVLLVVAARPGSRWIAVTGLGIAALLAVVGARARGRVPFRAALGIAAVNVAVLAAGGEALTR